MFENQTLKSEMVIFRGCVSILARMQTQYVWQERKVGCYYPEKHFINIPFVMANSEHLCFSGGDCCVFVDVR